MEGTSSASECKTPAENGKNTTPSSLKLSGYIARPTKQQRQRARSSSPLTDSVRRLLLAKVGLGVVKQQHQAGPSPLTDSVRTRLLAKVGIVESKRSGPSELESSTNSEVAQLESSTNSVSEVAGLESSTNSEVAQLESSTSITLDTLKGLLSKNEYRSLHVQTLAISDKTSVIVYRPYNDDSVGLISNPRLCLSEVDRGIEYSFQVFYNTLASGRCSSDFSEIKCYLLQLLTTSRYVICPGIHEYPSSIQFKTKNLVVWKEPFNRQFSTNCSQWHIPNNVSHFSHASTSFNCCKACRQLIHDIRQLQRSAEKVSDATRARRRSASSNYSISRLSPESQAIRQAAVNKRRKQHAKNLKKLNRLPRLLP